jgi:hypothetical protein
MWRVDEVLLVAGDGGKLGQQLVKHAVDASRAVARGGRKKLSIERDAHGATSLSDCRQQVHLDHDEVAALDDPKMGPG